MTGSLDKRVDVRILSPGRNWMDIGSLLAVSLDGYYSKLPAGSTVAAVTGNPGEMCMEGPRLVAEGRYHMCITTPLWYVGMARAGGGPFDEPLPLSVIAAFPHDDRLALAVRREVGVRSLREIAERKLPLKISMPVAEMHHPAGWVVEEVLRRHGFSPGDVEQWGGEILRDRPRFQNSPTAVPVDPRFDAVFDEAIMTRRWARITTEHDVRFLDIEPAVLEELRELGMAVGAIERGRLDGVDRDVPTIDFSGWALVCRDDMPEQLGYLTAQALDECHAAISARFDTKYAGMTAPIDMSAVADCDLPIHSGAAAYYQERHQETTPS